MTENLRLGSWLIRRDRALVETLTARVFELFPRLRERAGVQAGLLSGGEQQMLTIAQSLYCRPKLLLIDELSLGLAPSVLSQLLGVVQALSESGVTVVMVEQSLNLASSVAGTSVFMERGQVRFTGPTAQLADRSELARAVFIGSGRETAPDSFDGPRRQPDERGPAFSVAEVSRRFGGVVALDGVSLDAAPGEILGIIGANGAGKTTLFDIGSGFLAPTRGNVFLNGMDVTRTPAPQRARLGLGRVFQDAALFASLTVAETLAVAFERHLEVRDPLLCMLRTGSVARSEDTAEAAVEALIERFGLERYRDAFVRELSTGTRRVVELACAVAHRPSVLLLDEPTSGLAQRETEALGQLIVELREETGATFVVIEHDVPLVSSISDRLVCLHLGRVIAEGEPAAVVSDPAVVEAYLGTDARAIRRSGRAGRSGRSVPSNGSSPQRRKASGNGARKASAASRRRAATTGETAATTRKPAAATAKKTAADRKGRSPE